MTRTFALMPAEPNTTPPLPEPPSGSAPGAGHPNPDSAAPPTGTLAQTPDEVARSLAAANAPTSVAGYEILCELGRGGMGVVYKARQVKLDRVVALKMILSPQHAGAHQVARFLAEAVAVAAIRHPNVVQVFDSGEADGRPYMAMEYLEGGSLVDHLRTGGRMSPRVASELLVKVARGVQAAHDRGIVHRDLKPHNVLLDRAPRDRPASWGEPKVADFGLAKREGAAELTQSGAVLGTPAYMAPEQARGQTKLIGPRSDVWSLGVMLYECLTGQVPFPADEPWAVLVKVVSEEPVDVTRLDGGVPGELAAICRKCLAKAPADRYDSAGAFADDLQNFLDAKSVRAPLAPSPAYSIASPVEDRELWARLATGADPTSATEEVAASRPEAPSDVPWLVAADYPDLPKVETAARPNSLAWAGYDIPPMFWNSVVRRSDFWWWPDVVEGGLTCLFVVLLVISASWSLYEFSKASRARTASVRAASVKRSVPTAPDARALRPQRRIVVSRSGAAGTVLTLKQAIDLAGTDDVIVITVGKLIEGTLPIRCDGLTIESGLPDGAPATIEYDGEADRPLFEIYTSSSLRIRNVELNCANRARAAVHVRGSAAGMTFERVGVSQFREAGFLLSNAASRPDAPLLLDRVRVQIPRNAIGLHVPPDALGTNHIAVRNSRFEGARGSDSGIRIDAPTSALVAEHNRLYNLEAGVVFSAASYPAAASITDNTLLGVDRGFYFDQPPIVPRVNGFFTRQVASVGRSQTPYLWHDIKVNNNYFGRTRQSILVRGELPALTAENNLRDAGAGASGVPIAAGPVGSAALGSNPDDDATFLRFPGGKRPTAGPNNLPVGAP